MKPKERFIYLAHRDKPQFTRINLNTLEVENTHSYNPWHYTQTLESKEKVELFIAILIQKHGYYIQG